MRLLTRLAVGAAALVTLSLSAPVVASAGVNYGDSGGGTISGGSGGYTWLPGVFQRQRGCNGTEPEIGSGGTLRAPQGEQEPGYWQNPFMFEQRRQRNTAGGLGQAHCRFELWLAWGILPLGSPILKGGVAGGRVELTAQMCSVQVAKPGEDCGPTPIALGTQNLGTIKEPMVRDSPAEPWPTVQYTLVPQRTLASVTWTPSNSSGCTLQPGSGATFSFTLTSRDCTSFQVTARWEQRMLRTGSDGSSGYAPLVGTGLTQCLSDATGPYCVETTSAQFSFDPQEILSGYTNGQGGSGVTPNGSTSVRLIGSGTGSGFTFSPTFGSRPLDVEVFDCRDRNGNPVEDPEAIDKNTRCQERFIPRDDEVGETAITVLPDGTIVFGSYAVTTDPTRQNGGRGVNGGQGSEQRGGVNGQGDGNGDVNKKKGANGRTGGGGSANGEKGSGAADGDSSSSRMMKIGGFTGALLLLAAIAAGAFVFFGRRQRL